MKHFLSIMFGVFLAAGLSGPLQADSHVNRWRDFDRETLQKLADADQAEREEMGHRMDRLAERRERMRAFRDEMQRAQPRRSYRDRDDDWPRDSFREPSRDGPRDTHRIPQERRDFARPPMAPPSRDAETIRRLSPEERRQFRRQLHDAGRDVYRGQ